MADVTISGNVTPTSSSLANVGHGIAQVAITAGQSVFIDESNQSKVNLADADAVASALASGIALNDADIGGAISYVLDGGSITVSGAPFTVGEVYVVSATAGGIAPVADLLTGDFVTVLGVAITTSILPVNIIVSGVAKP